MGVSTHPWGTTWTFPPTRRDRVAPLWALPSRWSARRLRGSRARGATKWPVEAPPRGGRPRTSSRPRAQVRFARPRHRVSRGPRASRGRGGGRPARARGGGTRAGTPRGGGPRGGLPIGTSGLIQNQPSIRDVKRTCGAKRKGQRPLRKNDSTVSNPWGVSVLERRPIRRAGDVPPERRAGARTRAGDCDQPSGNRIPATVRAPGSGVRMCARQGLDEPVQPEPRRRHTAMLVMFLEAAGADRLRHRREASLRQARREGPTRKVCRRQSATGCRGYAPHREHDENQEEAAHSPTIPAVGIANQGISGSRRMFSNHL